MMKKVHIKFGFSFFMLVLLMPIFLTFGSVPAQKSGGTFFSNKSVVAQTIISFAELCEETEAKNTTETLHDTPFIQFIYSVNSFRSSMRKVENRAYVSFASTTNLPLYLAKQVFLI